MSVSENLERIHLDFHLPLRAQRPLRLRAPISGGSTCKPALWGPASVSACDH